MKNGLKNKNRIIICVVLSSMVLLGFGSSKIVLRNADEPFIDLTGSIGNSIGNAEESSVVPGASATSSAPNETPNTRVTSNDYRIVVRAEDVIVYNVINGVERIDRRYRAGEANDLERDIITNGFLIDKNIVLIDDYAEYKTYMEVVSILEKHFSGKYITDQVD